MLKTTPASVYSLLQRAHKAVRERLTRPSQQVTLRRLGDDALRRIVERYVNAWHDGDIDTLVMMLTIYVPALLVSSALILWQLVRSPVAEPTAVMLAARH